MRSAVQSRLSLPTKSGTYINFGISAFLFAQKNEPARITILLDVDSVL